MIWPCKVILTDINSIGDEEDRNYTEIGEYDDETQILICSKKEKDFRFWLDVSKKDTVLTRRTTNKKTKFKILSIIIDSSKAKQQVKKLSYNKQTKEK